MNPHEQEEARRNIAGLMSDVQQTEMKLLLARRWPPLKPLPVFKFETDEYRASIDFDKTRGDWFCRKTSLLSNSVEELRGALTEIVMAVPECRVAVTAECATAEPPEQESAKDARRRLEATREWCERYENGAFYSGLRDHLSESQQNEVADCIRLTLTARQLQFNPKNVAYVFDALSKTGGKFAALIEIAQRNMAKQGAYAPAKAEAAPPETERHALVAAVDPPRERRLQKRKTPATAYVELGDNNGGLVLNLSETGMAVTAAVPLVADQLLSRIFFQLPNSGQSVEVAARIVWLAETKRNAGIRFIGLDGDSRAQISNWIAADEASPELGRSTAVLVESVQSTPALSTAEKTIGTVFREVVQPSSPELFAQSTPQARKIAVSEVLDENPPSLIEGLREKLREQARVTDPGPQVRTGTARSSVHRIDPERSYVLEISGLQVAAVVFLFAAITLAVALTVRQVPIGRHPKTRESTPTDAATARPGPDRLGDTIARAADPPEGNLFTAPAVNGPAPAAAGSPTGTPPARSLNAPPEDSAIRVTPAQPFSGRATGSLGDHDDPETRPESKGPVGIIARNAPPPASSRPVYSPKAAGSLSGAPENPAPRGARPALRALSRTASTILVTGPGDGSKPFRLTLPEKPIAASSSFAMTSQLSVLVPPDPGSAQTHKPSRLEAGELVSFVWPSYPRPGDRYGSSETVRVRTAIGKLGQVLDIKLLGGSLSLLPAAKSAIRLWRYQPTLLNKKPVQAQQDVTIEFRPPAYFSHLTTQHPSRN